MISVLKLIEYISIDKKCKKPTPKILYESANFVVVNKPPDMRINSNTPSHYTVQTYLSETLPHRINPKLTHQFYFVHRLDYSTSGVLCVPLTKTACAASAKQFEQRQAEKYYVAVVRGLLSENYVVITGSIGEDVNGREVQKMCTADSPACTNPREATTLLLALEEGFYENYPGTKVVVLPLTGRRHQIRVHCAHLGHTIVGDYTYSGKRDVAPPRMFLHALSLRLQNKVEDIDIETDDPFNVGTYKQWTTTKTYWSLKQGCYLLRCNSSKFKTPSNGKIVPISPPSPEREFSQGLVTR